MKEVINNEHISDRQIINTRVFNAPREKVFQAWANPFHLAQWWGPKGFTNTFDIFEFKPEGRWEFTMHGPDGVDYPNYSRFIEIQAPEKIIFDHLRPMHRFRVTATFEEQGQGTLLTFAMVFDSAEECERVKIYVVPSNEENFDRLETLLSKI